MLPADVYAYSWLLEPSRRPPAISRQTFSRR